MKLNPKKPSKSEIRYADKYIALLRAFKTGKQVQRKTQESGWHDYDLGIVLRSEAVQYRIKK